MSAPFCLLVVAKAPVPGFAKTRLCPPASSEQAADIAASALLDTLDAVLATTDAIPVVAMTGVLAEAAKSAEIACALRKTTVIDQRGGHFGERLANAHLDVAERFPGLPVLQIGMDTPQVTAELLAEAADPVRRGERDAVLGHAEDGGWWALGLRDPRHARVLSGVPMSRPDTGSLTAQAFGGAGTLKTLSDVDTMDDARRVAATVSHTRFADAVGAVTA